MSKSNFLQDYLELNSGTEIPEKFALWCAISGISSVIGRKCWLDMGTYTIYPNFYIILVAGSGRMRKSTAIGVIEDMVKMTTYMPNMISQKTTPEALIKAMQAEAKVSDDGLRLPIEASTSEGYVIADELNTFLNAKSYEAGLANLLITMFDCKSSFEYHTIGRGVMNLRNICLNLLAGSTVDWIRNAIPADSVGSGLTSRILFVYEDVPPKPVAITSFSNAKVKLRDKLIEDLNEFSNIQGEFKIDPAAEGTYVDVYNKWYKDSSFYDLPYLSGYASRRHLHLTKLAMILSITESKDKIVKEHHITGAQELLVTIESNMDNVIQLILSNDQGTELAQIYQMIENSKHGVSRAAIISRFSNKIRAKEFKEIIQTLTDAGKIKVFKKNNTIYYMAL